MSSGNAHARAWITGLLSVALIATLGLSFAHRATAQGTQASATVRFVHAIVGGPPVDVLLDGEPIAKNLAYGTATEYAPLPAGDHGIKVVQAGQDQSQPLIDKTIMGGSGAAYNFIIGSQNNAYQAQLLSVDLHAIPVGQSRYRIVQASPDLGDVSIGLGVENNASNGANAAASNTNGGFLADNGYLQVASGTYTLRVFNSSGTSASFTSPSITLTTGKVYDLVVIGANANRSLQVLPLVTSVFEPCSSILNVGTPSDSCVRFIHVSPDVGPVDILIDGGIVVKNISYGAVTRSASLSAADHQVQIFPAGQTTGSPLLDQTITFTAGQAYLFSVLGFHSQGAGGSQGLRLHQDQIDLTPLPTGQARVRLVQAVPGGGQATVTTAQGAALINAVSFGDSSDYVVLNAGSYDLTVKLAQAGSQNPITLNAKNTQFKEGTVYDLFVIGRPQTNSVQVLVLTAPASVRTGAQGTPVSIESPVASPAASEVGAAAVTAISATPASTPAS